MGHSLSHCFDQLIQLHFVGDGRPWFFWLCFSFVWSIVLPVCWTSVLSNTTDLLLWDQLSTSNSIFSLSPSPSPSHLYFVQHLTEIIDHHWNHCCSASTSFYFEPTVTRLVHSSLLFWLISRPVSQAEQFSAMLLWKISKKLIGCVVQRDDMLFLKIISYKYQSTVLQISRKAEGFDQCVSKNKKIKCVKKNIALDSFKEFLFYESIYFPGGFSYKKQRKV